MQDHWHRPLSWGQMSDVLLQCDSEPAVLDMVQHRAGQGPATTVVQHNYTDHSAGKAYVKNVHCQVENLPKVYMTAAKIPAGLDVSSDSHLASWMVQHSVWVPPRLHE